jgi:uncharacterized protein YkwD
MLKLNWFSSLVRGCRPALRNSGARRRKRSWSVESRIECLEDRLLLTFNPTGLEQELLEHTNRIRTNPQGELDVLLTSFNPLQSSDPHVTNALNFFNVDANVLQEQWATLVPAPPLAWSEPLSDAAHAHNLLMIQFDQQSHQLPGEPGLFERFENAGWSWSGSAKVAENIYAFAQNPFHAHAGFVIDWGTGSQGSIGGIQNPPGHRNNIMDPEMQEVGISIVPESNPNTNVGPQVVTQDFAMRGNYGNPNLLGVVFDDANDNGRYEAGEGMGGVTIDIVGTGGTFSTTTWSAGGYQVKVPSGTYTVTASGGAMPQPVVLESVVVNTANVKVDFTAPPPPPPPPAADLVLNPIGDRTLFYDRDMLSIPLSATGTNGASVTYTVEAESLAFHLDRQLGLFQSGNYSPNWGGLGERWIRGDNSVWYYITPTGEFYHWHGGSVMNRSLVALLDSSFHANPTRLHDASLPYALDQELGLFFSGSYSTNWGGLGEKWIRGSGNVWYYIIPDGTFYRWHGGSITNRTLIAQLDPVYHTSPSLLHNAQFGLAEATVNVSGTTLTVNRDPGAIGTLVLTVSVSDGQRSDSETFRIDGNTELAFLHDQTRGLLFSGSYSTNWGGLGEKWIRGSGSIWYYITPDGKFYQWHGGSISNRTLRATFDESYHADPRLLHDSTTFYFDQRLGLNGTGNLSFNWGGLNEKWVRGHGGRWYYVTPDGNLYRWHGGAVTNRTLVTKFSTAVYANPQLLYRAQNYVLDRQYDFSSTGSYNTNWGGLSEKWFRGAGSIWYYVTPSGDVYRWLGGSVMNRRFVTQVHASVHADPSLLHDATWP